MADDTTKPAKPCPFAAKVAHDIATAPPPMPVDPNICMMSARLGYTDLLEMALRGELDHG